jgi:hypothetical protein
VIGRDLPGAFHLPNRAVRFGFEDQRDDEMKVEVICYSGYKGDERPVRFGLDSQEYFVEELLDQWYCGPKDIFFKVRANDGNVYILRRCSSGPEGEWSLEFVP